MKGEGFFSRWRTNDKQIISNMIFNSSKTFTIIMKGEEVIA